MPNIRTNARLLAASALTALSAAPALADIHGVVSSDPTPVTIAAGDSITGDKSGVYSDGTELNLTNNGSIRGNGLNAFTSNTDAGVAFKGGPANITNTGTISGARFGISSFYFFTSFADPNNPVWDGRAIGSSLTNSGSIIGDSDDGVRFIGGGDVVNSGYIAGRVGSGADGISMFSFEGQDLSGFTVIGTVTNLASGVIEGNRFGIILSNGGTVENAGAISGASSGIVIQAQSFDPGRAGLVTNSGTINGAVSFNGLASGTLDNSGTIIAANGSGVRGISPLTVDNSATGVIQGSSEAILVEGASATITNAGTLRGNGGNNGVLNTDGGVVITGGPAEITNSGSISGAQFGISTSFYFNPITNQNEGRAIGSEVVNSGSIIGDNNDGVRLIGGGSVVNSGYISGRVSTGADGVSMFSFDGQDLTSFAVIGSVTNLAGGVIEGNRNGIILSNGGTVDNAGTISGNSGSIYMQAQSFDPGRTGTVVNSGTLNGAVGFNGLATASVNNSGAINGFIDFGASSGSLDNSGTVSSLTDGAAVRGAGPISVNNDPTGVIEGLTSGIFARGATFSVTNAGTIYGAGTYDGYGATPDGGIAFDGGPATIVNTGLITGEGFGITSLHYYNATTGLLAPRSIGSSITNSGDIVGIGDDGVRLIGGGAVTNSGLISGGANGSFAFADGISIFSLTDQDVSALTSIGTVTNLAGGVIEGWRFGLTFGNGGTVDNAGTISGGTAGILIQDYIGGGGKVGTITNSGTVNGGVRFFGIASASVTNSGTIVHSAGEAIRNSAGTPLTILNAATGVIDGSTSGIFDEGPGLVVDNAGSIYAAGTYDGFDAPPDAGITFSGGPATVANSGLIMGEGFGISSAHFYNSVTTLLEPRAIGSTVTNRGQIVGVNNDGVRLIGGGTITNSGLVSGGVGGTFAFADGISMFALNGQDISGLTSIGTVTNLAGGTIEGERFGIILSNGGTVVNAGSIGGGVGGVHIQDGSNSASKIGDVTNSGTIDGGVSFNALAGATLTNSGAITSSTGAAVGSTGPGAVSLVNSGVISGTGATAVQLGSGNDSVQLSTGSLISGAVDGGAGTDSVTLTGKGTKAGGGEVIGSFANFETLGVASGYWTASGAAGNFTSIQIGAGTLAVDGSIGGSVGVSSLGRLTGSGTVNGSISVAGGGTLAPGSGIGTLRVNGNVAFSSGAKFQVDASTRTADQLAITGTATIGSNVAVSVAARNGNYAPTTTFSILTATGGITGQFSGVTTDLAFLAPSLVHGANSVTLNLVRNSKRFTAASTVSTFQVASAVEGLGGTSSVYTAVLGQSQLGASNAFAALGSSATGLSERLLLGADEGVTWSALAQGSPGLFAYRSALRPVAAGAAYGQQLRVGPLSAMLVAGERSDRVADEASAAAIHTNFIEAAVGAQLGRFQLGLSARTAHSDLDLSRQVAFDGFAETNVARGEIDLQRLTMRGQYALLTGRTTLAAHANYSHDRVRLSAIDESGGASALSLTADTRTIHRGELGLRLAHKAELADGFSVSPWIDVAAQTTWGDVSNDRTARFASGSDSFAIAGAPLNRRALRLDAGVTAAAGALGWSVNYRALLGDQQSDHALAMAFSLRF
ncbi:hypothetical protein [Sphingomonas mesophila]|uniref:hypothetical protein n=1 Tax=Sphingomonas mesophila TaxID=2303576 RepID=UPI000E5681A4|nr:hypothetical protein [Sphingomonas mesophila]